MPALLWYGTQSSHINAIRRRVGCGKWLTFFRSTGRLDCRLQPIESWRMRYSALFFFILSFSLSRSNVPYKLSPVMIHFTSIFRLDFINGIFVVKWSRSALCSYSFYSFLQTTVDDPLSPILQNASLADEKTPLTSYSVCSYEVGEMLISPGWTAAGKGEIFTSSGICMHPAKPHQIHSGSWHPPSGFSPGLIRQIRRDALELKEQTARFVTSSKTHIIKAFYHTLLSFVSCEFGQFVFSPNSYLRWILCLFTFGCKHAGGVWWNNKAITSRWQWGSWGVGDSLGNFKCCLPYLLGLRSLFCEWL